MRPQLLSLSRAPQTLFSLLLAALLLCSSLTTAQTGNEVANSNTPPVNITQTDDATLNLHRWGAVTLFHGLPSDRVRAIVEDNSGAIWIGTDNGLVRYDGHNTQAFAQENALPSRRILALAVDAHGALWIGTESGAARWRNEQLEVLAETRGRAVNAISASTQGDVVTVTNQGELIRYQLSAAPLTRSQLAEPQRLIASKLDAASHRLLNPPEQNANEAGALKLTVAAVSPAGVFYIGSSGRGAMIHRSVTGQPDDQLREIALHPPRPYHLNAVFAEGDRVWLGEQSGRTPGLWLLENNTLTRLPINTGTVTAIHGEDGNVWVGTWAQGAFLLRNGQVIEHLTFENTGGGLRSNRINTLYRDREGIIWFGTDRGVCRYDRDSFRAATLSNNAESNYVRTLLQARDGVTWCGTNRGLFYLPSGADLGPWIEVPEIHGRAVHALLEDKDRLWVGTSNGLFVRERAAAAFTRVNLEEKNQAGGSADNEQPVDSTATEPVAPEAQARESVRALALFRGALYAAVFGRGLVRLDSAGRISLLDHNETKNILCLAVEGEQTLWLGTLSAGLWRYDGAQFSASNQSLPQEAVVRTLAIEPKRMWIGTSSGLYLREGEKAQQVFANVDVLALQITRETGEREIVWCGTRHSGLIKYLPKQAVSIRFDTEQGLASSQVWALAARPEAAHLWIGTNRGVVRHQPSLAQPHLEVRRLVADRTYAPEYLTAELSLPSTLRNMLLEVTALGGRTYQSQFQYEFTFERRDGGESRTIKTAEPQFAADNLRTGPYVLYARAISRDLVYSEPLVVRLRVRNPPFPWPTVLLAALLALAVAVAVWVFRQRQQLALTNASLEKTNAELREMRIRLANETETERARIARDLHDQTLGDLRHLLVLTDQLPQPAGDSGALTQQPTPQILRREIESISNEIRHICEDLSPSVLANIGFLPALEWALADAVRHLPAAEKFAYEFVCAPELEERLRLSAIEEIQLYRIVQEALNNVCRHAHARNVQLSVRAENLTDFVIEIEDDGIGFDGAALANVTGHGIANIRSRASLIGAQVEWHAAQPGCRFRVRQARVIEAPADEKAG
jgi:ligand-binding sensor domain-containing protein/signal transduction histidine kinase